MKKWLKIILVLILVGVLASGGIFGYILGREVAHGFVYQNIGNDTSANSLLQLEAWGYDVEAFETRYEKDFFELKSIDAEIIPVVRLTSEKSEKDRVVVLVHGLGGDYVSTYPQAEIYLEAGFEVVAYDQRASGASRNEVVSFGYFEQEDLAVVVEFMRDELGPEGLLVVHGMSMGGATVGLYLGSDAANLFVDYAILDSAFDSMAGLFDQVWTSMETGIPAGMAYRMGSLYLSRQFGFKFSDVDVLKSLEKTKVPTMILHGARDGLFPVDMAMRLYEAVGADAKAFWLMDSEHVMGVVDAPDLYRQYVLDFIK